MTLAGSQAIWTTTLDPSGIDGTSADAHVEEGPFGRCGRLDCLRQGEVHVCCAWIPALRGQLARLRSALSEDERARADRCVREADAQQFTIGRGLLRSLLGKYLETAADELQFSYGLFGKPTLELLH
jgi:hypothetical protein